MIALVLVGADSACAQAPASPSRVQLGVAVDTTRTSRNTWGYDPAMDSVSAVVRTWEAFAVVRGHAPADAHWSALDRTRHTQPDLAVVEATFLAQTTSTLLEVVPLTAGDATDFQLLVLHSVGTPPVALAIERVLMTLEAGRYVLRHPIHTETASWQRARAGPIDYVVHPELSFDVEQARAAAAWVDTVAARFGLGSIERLTYYQVPDLQASRALKGLDWFPSADRLGGTADVKNRIVWAGDPRHGSGFRHEIAHVLFGSLLAESHPILTEAVAYWLAGTRDMDAPMALQSARVFARGRRGLSLERILESEEHPAASLRFASAALLLDWVHQQRGDEGVLQLLRTHPRTDISVTTLATALGMQPRELEAAWQRLIQASE